MKNYNWFKKFIDSLAPTNLYIVCQKERFTKSIAYIIILILLSSLVSGVIIGNQVKKALDKTISDYDSGIIKPIHYSFDKGLEYDCDDGVIIKHFSLPIVVDTKNSINTNELYDIGSYLLFDNEKFTLFANNNPLQVFYYKNAMLLDISAEEFKKTLAMSKVITIPTYIVITFLFSIFSTLYTSIFIMFTTNIFLMFNGIRIKLSKLYQLVLYAMTVPILWQTLVVVIRQPMPILLDNFVVYAYPIILLLTVFRRMKKDIVNNLK